MRAHVCVRAHISVCACAYVWVRMHMKGLKAPFSLVSFLPKRGPVPLLLMPEASSGGLPGFLFFAAAAAASHSACAALYPATRSACAFPASSSAAFFLLAVSVHTRLMSLKKFAIPSYIFPMGSFWSGLGGFPSLSPFINWNNYPQCELQEAVWNPCEKYHISYINRKYMVLANPVSTAQV